MPQRFFGHESYLGYRIPLHQRHKVHSRVQCVGSKIAQGDNGLKSDLGIFIVQSFAQAWEAFVHMKPGYASQQVHRGPANVPIRIPSTWRSTGTLDTRRLKAAIVSSPIWFRSPASARIGAE